MSFPLLTPARSALARRRGVLAAALCSAAAAGACTAPDPVPEPWAVPFDPPAVYIELWVGVEACSGRRGDFGRVEWRLADAFPGRPGRLALWSPPHTITLRSDLDVALPVVAHEILHDLLQGDAAHEDPAWLDCALPVLGAEPEVED